MPGAKATGMGEADPVQSPLRFHGTAIGPCSSIKLNFFSPNKIGYFGLKTDDQITPNAWE